MKTLSFELNYERIRSGIELHQAVQEGQVKPVLDSVLLTMKEVEELTEDIARKFQLSSINNPKEFAQQYISSIINPKE